MENITNQINSFLSTLKTIYSQQGQIGKIILPLFLLAFCCACSFLFRLLQTASSANTAVPTPFVFPTQGNVATPTPLFNFGSTPLATLSVPTALPTTPSPATITPTITLTQTPTQIAPTETATLVPTNTVVPVTPTSSGTVQIISVNKAMEYVDLQNFNNAPVDISGWKLVSVTGNQPCALSGVLQPNEVLRVWAKKGDTGFSCGYLINIWNDNQKDPAVLYDAQGKPVSRYPK
jgi:hypothetical protein